MIQQITIRTRDNDEISVELLGDGVSIDDGYLRLSNAETLELVEFLLQSFTRAQRENIYANVLTNPPATR